MTLFNSHPLARARRADPATSHIAAAVVERSGRAECQRAQCLAAIRATPGMTAGEIDQWCGFLGRYVAGRRMPELRENGMVTAGTARLCSVRGSRMQTWCPVAAARGDGA